MSAPETIIVVDGVERPLTSLFRNANSFGSLMLTAWFLNTVIPPSGWLNAALGIVWVLWLLGKSAGLRMKMTPEQARAWLDERYPRAAGSLVVSKRGVAPFPEGN